MTELGEIKKLSAEEKWKARALYEEIFAEDSEGFVDYYFRAKAAENEIYAVMGENKLLSMLHLNPYPMHICGSVADSAYIVAVATRAECRHQGMMASLLKASLRDLYRQKSPFTWLMPAAEAIYHPFGFRYMYRKNQMILDWKTCEKIEKRLGETEKTVEKTADIAVSCRIAEKADAEALADFAERRLAEVAEVYTCHDSAYFCDLIQGLESDGGHLVLLLEGEKIYGYFCAAGAAKEAWEIVATPKYSCWMPGKILEWFQAGAQDKIKISAFPKEWEIAEHAKKPIIMGRIVHLETFMKVWKIPKEKQWIVKLRDDLIPENNGCFHITAGPQGGSAERLDKEPEGVQEMRIGALQEALFETEVFLNELV